VNKLLSGQLTVPIYGEDGEVVTCQSGPGRGQHVFLTEPVVPFNTLAPELDKRRLRPALVQTVPDLKHSNQ